MNEKLVAILEGIGLSHDLLNHANFVTRREARKRLAKYYGEYNLVLETRSQSSAAKPRAIDGVNVLNATFGNITARTFANSAHGLQAWGFVTFAKIDKVIPVSLTEGVAETTTGQIGVVKAILNNVNTGILGVSIEPKENELRDIQDIPEDATETGKAEEAPQGLDGQLEVFAEKPIVKKGKKSV